MSPPLRIGVLILPPVQLLDVSPVDLFYIADKEYLEICNLPRPITALGLNTTTTYIAASGPFAECTASAALRVTADLATPSVQPGKLDILFLPGPDPNSVPGEEEKAFIRSHADVGTSILSVCTASFALGHAGILKGRKATGPRSLLGKMREMFPDTEWVDKRWIQDREIWCSGKFVFGGLVSQRRHKESHVQVYGKWREELAGHKLTLL